MRFHTFGDSHSKFPWIQIPKVKRHPIGPKLCYSFGKEKLQLLNISDKKYNVKNNDAICFCFGEIDCRCHIYKHVSAENSYQAIINEIVDDYFDAIKLNVDMFQNLKVFVFNVVPPIEKANLLVDPSFPFPFLGTDEDRKKYVLYFNKLLKEKCKEFNYNYLDVYDKYTDKNGFLNKNYSDGNVHIKDFKFIKDFLIKLNYGFLFKKKFFR